MVFLAYLASAFAALLLLHFLRARKWYWHVISVLAALVIGLVPLPEPLQSPQGTLVVGVTFLFLFLWGVAAPFFRKPRQRADEVAS